MPDQEHTGPATSCSEPFSGSGSQLISRTHRPPVLRHRISRRSSMSRSGAGKKATGQSDALLGDARDRGGSRPAPTWCCPGEEPG